MFLLRVCVHTNSTYTHNVKCAQFSVLCIISGYPIMLAYHTAWESPVTLVHANSSAPVGTVPPVGEQLSYEPLLLPSLTIFILPCALHSSPLARSPICFLLPSSFLPITIRKGNLWRPQSVQPRPSRH